MTTIPFLSCSGEVSMNLTISGTKLVQESRYREAAISEADPANFLTVGRVRPWLVNCPKMNNFSSYFYCWVN